MGSYKDEITFHMEQAVAHVQAAKASLEAGQAALAASRAAQAAFHSGSALLLDEEIEPGRHGDVITRLHKIFVQGRRLTKEQGANLSWLFALRNAASPDKPLQMSSVEARRAVEIAASFLDAAKVILEA